ncbi:MAG: MotA/TolQ/ExbB proton channel family protein [Simkaniaceae bacterium]|nr:MotA/TolQ/ExbB proton channel family protein [Simkaniaceae bacterium]
MKRIFILFFCLAAIVGAETEQTFIETVAKHEIMQPVKKVLGKQIDMRQVFSGAPTIYMILLALSTGSLCLWIYTWMTIRRQNLMPRVIRQNLRTALSLKAYDDALSVCSKKQTLYTSLVKCTLEMRGQNLSEIREVVKDEGKRLSRTFWQRISLMNDIAVIAPMLGLLGTVVGMFYAFYDLNRSAQSLSSLFDGLGVSVGTTVAGLIVSLLAMGLYITLRYKLIGALSDMEEEVLSYAKQMDLKNDSR